jgi:hypothetical protein
MFCVCNRAKSFSGRGEMGGSADKVKVATSHHDNIELNGISHL